MRKDIRLSMFSVLQATESWVGPRHYTENDYCIAKLLLLKLVVYYFGKISPDIVLHLIVAKNSHTNL